MKALKRLFAAVFLIMLAIWLPSAAWGWPGDELKLGSQGEDVKFLQQKLQQAGYYPEGELSSHFGLNTLVAVTQFEKANNLNTDGKVTEEDWKILAHELYEEEQIKHSEKLVLTYYVSSKWAEQSMSKYGSYIDYSAKFSHYVTPDGNLVGQVPLVGLDIAQKNNIKTLLVVHNMEGPNAMDGKALHLLLNSTTKRQKLIQNILQLIEKYHFAGVNIDFEFVLPVDREQYSTFLAELKQVLAPKGYLVTAAIPAKTVDNPQNSWSGAYDYQKIGQLVDYVILMTYDEHGSWSKPGPVASLPWVEDVIKFATGKMPSKKILMGVPAYGNEWSGSTLETLVWTNTLIWKNINKLTQYGAVQWHDTYSAPYIIYNKNNLRHEAWFENRFSLNIKLNLIDKYNLTGIALWKLGLEDDTFWQTINEKL